MHVRVAVCFVSTFYHNGFGYFSSPMPDPFTLYLNHLIRKTSLSVDHHKMVSPAGGNENDRQK